MSNNREAHFTISLYPRAFQCFPSPEGSKITSNTKIGMLEDYCASILTLSASFYGTLFQVSKSPKRFENFSQLTFKKLYELKALFMPYYRNATFNWGGGGGGVYIMG